MLFLCHVTKLAWLFGGGGEGEIFSTYLEQWTVNRIFIPKQFFSKHRKHCLYRKDLNSS